MNVSELHPEEALDLYEAGRLGPRESEALEAHLARCPSCAAHVQWRSDVQASLAESGAGAAEARRLAAAALARRGIPAPVRAEAGVKGRRRMMLAAIIAVSVVSGAAFAKFWPSIERAWQRLSAPARPAPPPPRLPGRQALAPGSENREPRPPAAELPAPPSRPAPAERPRPPPAHRPAATSARPDRRQPLDDLVGTGAPAPSPVGPAETRPPSPLDPLAVDRSVTAPPPVSAARLFADVAQARRAGWLSEAHQAYGQLAARFAGSREERAASVVLGQLTLERGQLADALARFEGYLGTDPDGALAEEARLGRALALEQLGQREDAQRAWQELLQKHPGSVHAGRARARLESLHARPPDPQDRPR
jgi:TolA-binding protein